MKIDPDGIFRIYSYKLNQDGNRSVILESSTDRCSPKGLCGFNAYCFTTKQGADCECLPGFTPVKEGNSSVGCEGDFSMQSCNSDDQRNQYTMKAVANTVWEDAGYSDMPLLTKEDCEAACLEYCVCEAAIFKEQNCRKQKLPLRFGRWEVSDQNVALIKIGLPASTKSTKHEGKPKPDMVILIIGLSLIGLVVLLVFFGALVLRSYAFTYKKVSTKSSINLCENDNPYYVIKMEKEDCKKSCQEDCYCGAVLYSSGNCNKYKLPLRDGRRSKNISTLAFIKLVNVSSTNDIPLVPSSPHLLSYLAISLGSITCLCFFLAISGFLIYKQRIHSYRKLTENRSLGLTEQFTLRSFSYNELVEATDGFKEELGRGSFGAVYKGTLPVGVKIVAIKRLENIDEVKREFQTEMTAIGRTNHRNLVRLLGYCVEGSKKLLVYEYLSKGSLADFLFHNKVRPTWKERVRIALDVAKGILYLHEECVVRIIHCNIKPKNILLDDSLTAKISGFGLAKLLMPNQISITWVKGTGGHSAPERQRNALISVKVDVYSFGIILLEIICCRSNIEVKVCTADEILLSSWAYNCFHSGELNKLVEDEEVDLKMLERMVKVGLWCIQDDPTLRPSMKNVILMLEGTMDVSIPPSPLHHSLDI